MLVAELIQELYEAPLDSEIQCIVKPIHNETEAFEISIMDVNDGLEIVRLEGCEE